MWQRFVVAAFCVNRVLLCDGDVQTDTEYRTKARSFEF
jgi:hypothetical protein